MPITYYGSGCYDFRTKHLIKQALCKNQFLKNLNTNQISEIVDVMYMKDFEAGAYVIRKGDPGTDSFHTIYTFVQRENFQLFLAVYLYIVYEMVINNI